eukprot:m.44084 g.44084  ORF g.44084 m.44084 type:complete len:1025 (+) comp10048_c0_seq2:48-3122(+)
MSTLCDHPLSSLFPIFLRRHSKKQTKKNEFVFNRWDRGELIACLDEFWWPACKTNLLLYVIEQTFLEYAGKDLDKNIVPGALDTLQRALRYMPSITKMDMMNLRKMPMDIAELVLKQMEVALPEPMTGDTCPTDMVPAGSFIHAIWRSKRISELEKTGLIETLLEHNITLPDDIDFLFEKRIAATSVQLHTVGKPGVGKTKLVHWLQWTDTDVKKAQREKRLKISEDKGDADSRATLGTNYKNIDLDGLKFAVRDHGGHTSFRIAQHGNMQSPCSIYLLVFNIAEQDDLVRDHDIRNALCDIWSSIQMRTQNSGAAHLILVGSRVDQIEPNHSKMIIRERMVCAKSLVSKMVRDDGMRLMFDGEKDSFTCDCRTVWPLEGPTTTRHIRNRLKELHGTIIERTRALEYTVVHEMQSNLQNTTLTNKRLVWTEWQRVVKEKKILKNEVHETRLLILTMMLEHVNVLVMLKPHHRDEACVCLDVHWLTTDVIGYLLNPCKSSALKSSSIMAKTLEVEPWFLEYLQDPMELFCKLNVEDLQEDLLIPTLLGENEMFEVRKNKFKQTRYAQYTDLPSLFHLGEDCFVLGRRWECVGDWTQFPHGAIARLFACLMSKYLNTSKLWKYGIVCLLPKNGARVVVEIPGDREHSRFVDFSFFGSSPERLKSAHDEILIIASNILARSYSCNFDLRPLVPAELQYLKIKPLSRTRINETLDELISKEDEQVSIDSLGTMKRTDLVEGVKVSSVKVTDFIGFDGSPWLWKNKDSMSWNAPQPGTQAQLASVPFDCPLCHEIQDLIHNSGGKNNEIQVSEAVLSGIVACNNNSAYAAFVAHFKQMKQRYLDPFWNPVHPYSLEKLRVLRYLKEQYKSMLAPEPGDPAFQMLTVFHGVSGGMEVAEKICKTGFGVTCLRNDGFFGYGAYFTPDLKYAMAYNKVVIMCNVLVFNAYPVTEQPVQPPNPLNIDTFYGKPITAFHDMHVAVVNYESDLKIPTVPQPLDQWEINGGPKEMVTELALSEVGYVLPRCILIFK